MNPHCLPKFLLPFSILSLGALTSILPAAEVAWQGGSGNWDLISPNWNGAPWNNASGDTAVFGGASGIVTLTEAISAGGLTFQVNDYTLTGSTLTLSGSSPVIQADGSNTISSIISGTNGFEKTGAGNLILGADNAFSGNVTIRDGRLTMAHAGALGPSLVGTKEIHILNGGQLDLNGQQPAASNQRAYTFFIEGNGSDSQGAIINTAGGSPVSYAAIHRLVLSEDASIGGNGGRFDVGRTSHGTAGGIEGNNFTLTKKGTSTVNFRGDATNFNLIVEGGTAVAENTNLAFGGATGHVTVNSGAVLSSYGPLTLANAVTLKQGAILANHSGDVSNWTGNITLDGNATLQSNGGRITISGSISSPNGDYGFTKTGSSEVLLSGNNSFTGNVTVNQGKLTLGHVNALGPSTLGAKRVTVNNGGQVDLNGISFSNGNPVAYTYAIQGAGADGQGAIINTSATLIYSHAAIYRLELNGDAAIGGNGGRYDIGYTSAQVSGGIEGGGYTLTKKGTSTVHVRGNSQNIHWNVEQGTLIAETAAQAFGGPNSRITVHANGTIGNYGDYTIDTPITFEGNGKLTNFAGNSTWTGPITLKGTPTISGSSTAQNINLAGPISEQDGSYGLIKAGNNHLTLSGNNTFTGDIDIQAGKLILNNANALGRSYNGDKTIHVRDGAQLDFNGMAPAQNSSPKLAYTLSIAGFGTDGMGAIVNNSPTSIVSWAGVQNLILTADAAVGGNGGRFDLGKTDQHPIGTIDGGGHTLYKRGTSTVFLRGNAINLPNIVVEAGSLVLEDADNAFGGASGHVRAKSGTSIGSFGARTIATPLTLEGGSTLFSAGHDSVWTGLVTLEGNANVQTNGATITLNGVVRDSGGNFGINKTATGTLVLRGNNEYHGVTQVTAGNLALAGNGTLGNSSEINIASGAEFQINQRDSDYTYAGRLSGNGNIRTGDKTLFSTGVVAPGNSPRTLNLFGTMTMQGSFEADLQNPTSDQLIVHAGSQLNIQGATLTGTWGGGSVDVKSDPIWLILNNNTTGGLNGVFENSKLAEGYSAMFDGYAPWLTEVDGQTFALFYNANYGASGSGIYSGGNDLLLFAVPEPSKALLGMMALLPMLMGRRRRQA